MVFPLFSFVMVCPLPSMLVSVAFSIGNTEIIEEYPNDKYSPSCLVNGVSKAGRHLHVQISVPPTVAVITAYDPDPTEWIGYRVRRTKA
jgi:hypothetical protein